MASSAGWHLWIDRGGTFTDIVARRPDGALLTHKLLSEAPERYADAALEGIAQLMGLSGAPHEPLSEGALREAPLAEVRMGTTVATNALLERAGTPTVWVTNAGLADLLVIGTQARPDIFALSISRPLPLYSQVVEVDCRVAADGALLCPLDEDKARVALASAWRAGARACAISLMHADRWPEHERRVGELASEVGFEQVSLSHEVAPVMRLLRRAGTAVADAYLSAVLSTYVRSVRAALGAQVPLRFMQSSGALVDGARFAGRNSLLSGPAGGLVGAAAVGRAAGFDKVIAFDMGGTSTDVALHNGGWGLREAGVIDGVHLQVPTLDIHTVAAGGGSRVGFEGGRLRVGPQSAGARPGPACYGLGGPLTVTDCNVLLGRVQPAFMPRVFGPGGGLPLDADATRAAFATLAAEVGLATGAAASPEGLAADLLTLATARMAQAIKSISVERGHDPQGYALVAFGGAGGQHACAIAEALGMRTLLLHPLAGVLSAVGVGLAPLGTQRLASVQRPLSAQTLVGCATLAEALEAEARDDLAAQGASGELTSRWLCLRYAGTDTSLDVRWQPDAAAVASAFHAAHAVRFGFNEPTREITVGALRIEVQESTTRQLPEAPAPETDCAAADHVRLWSGGRWFERVPVFERPLLGARQRIDGPAVVVEGGSTTVIDLGWRAQLGGGGALVLSRGAQEAARTPDGPEVGRAAKGPELMRLELYAHRFRAIAEQMGLVLQATSHSVNIKERLDFSCALFDDAGRLVANAPHIPVHLGSMGESVAAIRARFSGALQPGDSFAINDPYSGGTHLPDITVVSPLVDATGGARFWVASRGHHADVGGLTPGSMPPMSRHIDDEGVRIEGARICEGGRFLDAQVRALLGSGPHPARSPERNLADLKAQLAANTRGLAELEVLCAERSEAEVLAYMGHVREAAAEAVRQVIEGLVDGSCEVPLDDGDAIRVQVRVDRAARSAHIDFSGTSPQRADNFNAPRAVCRAAVLYAFRTLVGVDIPLNDGCMAPLELTIPPGSMLDPRPPAAVVAGNVETSQLIVDALLGAVGALAASQGTMNNLTFGDGDRQYYETLCGGAGAGSGFDGASGVHTHMTNSHLTDPEVLEVRFPVILRSFGLRHGSGGGGRWRGGDGVVRAIEFRAPMTAALLSGRRLTRPFGLRGGGDGLSGAATLTRADGSRTTLPACVTLEVNPGDVLTVQTPGGGGFGQP